VDDELVEVIMELRLFEDFLTVVECGSFSLAAGRCNCLEQATEIHRLIMSTY
jgi:hypothetical protein